MEVAKDDASGDLWFNKACSSHRVATGILNPELKKVKAAKSASSRKPRTQARGVSLF